VKAVRDSDVRRTTGYGFCKVPDVEAFCSRRSHAVTVPGKLSRPRENADNALLTSNRVTRAVVRSTLRALPLSFLVLPPQPPPPRFVPPSIAMALPRDLFHHPRQAGMDSNNPRRTERPDGKRASSSPSFELPACGYSQSSSGLVGSEGSPLAAGSEVPNFSTKGKRVRRRWGQAVDIVAVNAARVLDCDARRRLHWRFAVGRCSVTLMVPRMVHLQDVVKLHTFVLGHLGALLLACFGFDLRFALVAF